MGLLLCGCCFSGFTAKTNEIILITGNVIALFFIVLSLIKIHWTDIFSINLILFITMLIIILACLTFSIMLRYWRGSNVIKTTKKAVATKIATADFALTIIGLIVCVVEEITIIISFSKIKAECGIIDDNMEPIYYRRILSTDSCQVKKARIDNEYSVAYISLSYIELMFTLSICIVSILKRRIINKTDLDYPIAATRQVIVVPVQPMGAIEMANNNNYGYFPQPVNIVSNQVPYSYSNRYMDPQQLKVSANEKSSNISKISKSDISSNNIE